MGVIGNYISRRPQPRGMVALNAVFGVVFLVVMVLITAGLTWMGLQEEPLPVAENDDEAA